MNQPGEIYRNSNKINLAMIVPGLLVGVGIAVLSGFLYGLISYYNPFIYLNFIALAIAVFGAMGASAAVKYISKSRNRVFDILTLALMGYVTWHASWTYLYDTIFDKGYFVCLIEVKEVFLLAKLYAQVNSMSVSRLGIGGTEMPHIVIVACYIVEFAAFFVPIFLKKNMFGNHYFCEDCNQAISTKEFYVQMPSDLDGNMHTFEHGNLSSLNELSFVGDEKEIVLSADGDQQVLHVEISNCKSCERSSIVDIYSHRSTLDDKGKRELKNKKKLLQGVYFDRNSLKNKTVEEKV